MSKKTALFLSALLFALSGFSQDELTLNQVIEKALNQSIQSKINLRQVSIGQLDYDIFRTSMMPSLSMNATVPNLNRSLDRITLPDGTDNFVQRSQMYSTLGLSVNQPLIWTGGNIYFNSQMQRIDIFGENPSTSYLANPVSFGFSQPIFGFNNFRWARKISPLQFKITQKQTIENKEDVAIRAVQLYYNWLSAEAQFELAKNFRNHNDTIYQISKGRYEMGKIAENDLLQAELNSLNSNIQVKQTDLQLTLSKMRLEQFMVDQLLDRSPTLDTNLEEINIPIDKAILLAQESMSTYDSYEMQLIAAEREVARARSNNSPTVNLFATYGLTNSGADVNAALANQQDRQLVVLDLDVPIYQFGYNQKQTQRAKINQEIVAYDLQLQQQALEQMIFERISNFTVLQTQVAIARKADEVANKGYLVTRQRFMIGKIDLLELNQAVTRKTTARMDYINALRDYWTAYYEIRKLTHFDFKSNTPIAVK